MMKSKEIELHLFTFGVEVALVHDLLEVPLPCEQSI